MFSNDGYYSVPLAILVIREWQAANDIRFSDDDYSPYREAIKTLIDAGWSGVETELLSPSGNSFVAGQDFWMMYTEDNEQHELFDMRSGLTRQITDYELVARRPIKRRVLMTVDLLLARATTKATFLSAFYVGIAFAFTITGVELWSASELNVEASVAQRVTMGILALVVVGIVADSVRRLFKTTYHLTEAFSGFPIGWSVTVNANDLGDYLKKLQSIDDEEPTRTVGEESRVAKRILELIDRRPDLNRTEVRRLVGGNVSIRGFGRAWDKAREQRPSIGKPGRKPNS